MNKKIKTKSIKKILAAPSKKSSLKEKKVLVSNESFKKSALTKKSSDTIKHTIKKQAKPLAVTKKKLTAEGLKKMTIKKSK